ncbi:MAG: DUF2177 family protein [Xanthomonadales bacterium]|jgi:uncharacterized membrane protein|nr:DUF2177 family protein [Xanthomonadales bacterium]
MKNLLVYGASLLAFIAIDIVWINLVVLGAYEQDVGHLIIDQPRIGAAVGFYLLYVAGLVLLGVRPALRAGKASVAWLNGAVLGAFAYGTYALTNYAMFGPWTWHLVWTDMLWGVVLSSVVTAIGYAVGRRTGQAAEWQTA